MKDCVVLGQSWVAQGVAKALETSPVPLERAREHKDPAVVFHADICPNLDDPLFMWTWLIQTLATRQYFAKSHWIQHSPAEVLAGAGYVRPYTPTAEIRPHGLIGQVMGSLEWGLTSLGYSLAIVRTSLLYSGVPNSLIDWAERTIRQGMGRVNHQLFNPTPIGPFATYVDYLVDTKRTGIYHVASRGGPASFEDVLHFLCDCWLLPMPILEVEEEPLVNLCLRTTPILEHWQFEMARFLEEHLTNLD